jgi:hypothetical protein
MNDWMNPLSHWLLSFTAAATLLLAAALAGRYLLRRPAERMAVAWTCWLGLLALAIVSALPQWPRIHLSAWSAPQPATPAPLHSAEQVFVRIDSEPIVLPYAEAETVMQPSIVALVQAQPPALPPWNHIAASAWLTTASLALSWIMLGLVQTRRLLRSAQAAPTWIHHELTRLVGKRRRVPDLALSPRIATAAALSAFRPKILLPIAAADEACAPAVQAALAHEWAHSATATCGS